MWNLIPYQEVFLTHTLGSTALTCLDAVAGQEAPPVTKREKALASPLTASELDGDLATTQIFFIYDIH